MKVNVIGHRVIYLTISAIAVGIAVLAVAFFGFQEGIDFTGGTLWQFRITKEVPASFDVEEFFRSLPDTKDVRINMDASSNSYLARLPSIDEAKHQSVLKELSSKYPSFEEMSFQSIGPSVSAELRSNAIIAILLVLVGISLYIAFAFRKVSRPVNSWMYGWITLASLFHDVSIPAGLMAILGKFAGVEIDTNFVVALLVVVGFSVHDTIVVFDRIRENLSIDRNKSEFGTIINHSVNQTLARSINTSLTLILVLLALYFAGPAHLQYFILTLLVGVTTGIYSSVFVASPLLYLTRPKGKK